eukprot:CAMPEP_0118936330 /NCGR_PEP_ID=MMETSP1169-20130426/18080_1 /TAXON_ID=36882 /ORGANISM="Pyramimonas obovata, Strain CCMP722" /LENGTH=164 /DNA_ID=CAMNT_0006879531 /DNA_START=62 /DNA_END=556 /DNA_ORIENTATION=-
MRDQHGRFIRDSQDRRLCYVTKQMTAKGIPIFHLCDSLGSRRRVTISKNNHWEDFDPVTNVWVLREPYPQWNAPSGPPRSQFEASLVCRGDFLKKEYLIYDKNVDRNIVVAQVSKRPLNNSGASAGKEFYSIRVAPTVDRLLVLAVCLVAETLTAFDNIPERDF